MPWSPLQRDLEKTLRTAESEFDLTAGEDNAIRFTGKPGGRERVAALRELVEAVLNESESSDRLAEQATELQRNQLAAAERLEGQALQPCATAFRAIAESLGELADLAGEGLTALLPGALANVEARVQELEALLDSLE